MKDNFKKIYRDFITNYDCLYSLINNASTIFSSSKLEDILFDRLEKVFVVNAIGNILCAKYAIKYLSKNHGHNGVKSLISHQ